MDTDRHGEVAWYWQMLFDLLTSGLDLLLSVFSSAS